MEELNKEKNKKIGMEIINVISEEFQKNEKFNQLDEYTKLSLIEQTFIMKYAKFDGKVIVALALSMLPEDENFSKKSFDEKMKVHNIIKDIGLKLVLKKDNGTENLEFSEPVDEKIEQLKSEGVSEKIIDVLLGKQKI